MNIINICNRNFILSIINYIMSIILLAISIYKYKVKK